MKAPSIRDLPQQRQLILLCHAIASTYLTALKSNELCSMSNIKLWRVTHTPLLSPEQLRQSHCALTGLSYLYVEHTHQPQELTVYSTVTVRV